MPKDDYTVQHSYQDDFGGGPDPIMNEQDDPTKELGVSPKEFADELNKLDLDEPDSEDARERVEDLDEDIDQEGTKV